jgi:multiple sugar transport system substrate-binding protein
MHHSITRPARAAAVLGVLALGLTAACSSGGGSGNSTSGASTGGTETTSAAPLTGKILVWAWEPTLKKVVAQFEKDNPGVTVDLVNAGTGNDQYTALQNAVAAGSGIPDVAQIEYAAIPQFSFGNSLADLAPLGASSLGGTFTPGPWNSVKQGDKVYGLPMDSGPEALFYNKTVFDKYGLTVPTTWDEYLADAQKLHAADPNEYITTDTGDAGFTTSAIWQAGGHPYTVDGTNVKIDFSDAGSTKWATYWQQLIDQKLLSQVSGWSDEWFQGLGNGTIASLVIGAWMPANLESGAKAASGDWRVAPMPQWKAGDKATSENGGSSLAVMNASTNQELAYKFIQYATTGPGVQIRLDGGAFPATVADLNSDAFLNKEFPYFGGQKINQVLAESAKDVVPGWQTLPYQVYANSIFGDTVGKAYLGQTTLVDGLKAWQNACADYGNKQGFSVNK